MYGGRLKFSKILEKDLDFMGDIIWVTHYNDADQMKKNSSSLYDTYEGIYVTLKMIRS